MTDQAEPREVWLKVLKFPWSESRGERYGTPKTVAKWQRHTSVYSAPRDPKDTVLTRRKKR